MQPMRNRALVALCLGLTLLSLSLSLTLVWHIRQQKNPQTAVHFRGDELILDTRDFDKRDWNAGDWQRFDAAFARRRQQEGGPARGQTNQDWMREQMQRGR